jgi:hypothetical protein
VMGVSLFVNEFYPLEDRRRLLDLHDDRYGHLNWPHSSTLDASNCTDAVTAYLILR